MLITSKEFLVGSVFSKLKLSKGLMAGLLLGGTLGSVGVGLSASATSNSITFYACSNIKTGVLSATSTKAPSCSKTTTLVTWNSVGPQGAKGDPGTNGTNGAKGDTGAPGATGPQGVSGISLPNGDLFANGYLIMPNAYLYQATLNGANLNGANLRHSNLGEADLTGANLTNADLTGADLTHAKLLAADLTNATCPNGIVHGESGANC